MLRRLLGRLRHLTSAARARRELDEEMRFHLEALTEDLIRAGMDPKDARREARIRFGSLEHVHERTRQVRGLAALDEVRRNLSLALRRARRSFLFTSMFVLTLALCVALGTTVFSFVDGVLLRPLPYPAAERLAFAERYDPAAGKSLTFTAVSGRTWERVRDGGAPLARAVYSRDVRGVSLSSGTSAMLVQQQRVGAGYFRTLGVPPAMGREFTPVEDVADGAAVAILSHDLWKRAFASAPEILGQSIRLKGEEHTVVGIMPADFVPEQGADVWTPLRPSTVGEGGGANYHVLVRIPEEMSIAEADARLSAIEVPAGEVRRLSRLGLVPYAEVSGADARLPMLIVLLAAGLMIAVGCANLTGLQMARDLGRRRETATRQALGGGTGALIREALAENVLLGALGAGLGLVLAAFAIPFVEELARTHLGIWQDLRLDARSVAAALVITGLATTGFAVGPIVRSRSLQDHRDPMSGARLLSAQRHLARKLLLVGQVATVAALLFSAGLLVRSYQHLDGLDPGFDPDGVLTVRYSLDDARYAEAENANRLFDESLVELRRLPGVNSAAVALTLPYERALNLPVRLPGVDDARLSNAVYVTPDFISTLGIPLLRGRSLQDSDRAGQPPVALVNQAFVDTYLPDGPVVGSQIGVGCCGVDAPTIVGVVGDVRQVAGWGAAEDPVWGSPTLYLPAAQLPSAFYQLVNLSFSPSWVVRGGDDLARPITQVFRGLAPDLAVARVATMEDVMAMTFSWERLEAAFLSITAAFALLLACVGLFGLIAHDVHERRREMALRLAVGSSITRAVWVSTWKGVTLTAYGLTIGGIVGVALGRAVLHGFIYGVRPDDPPTLAAVLSILFVVATVASVVPAARVARIDPAEVLRGG